MGSLLFMPQDRVELMLCVKWGCGYGCQWQVISCRAAWTSCCLPRYPANIHHLQDEIIPLKTPLLWSLSDPLLCNDKPARKWLITHRCVIGEYCQPLLFFFSKGKSQHFLSPQPFSPFRNIKRRWEAHCLVIISHGCSPLSATELCLICLGRC